MLSNDIHQLFNKAAIFQVLRRHHNVSPRQALRIIGLLTKTKAADVCVFFGKLECKIIDE